MYGWSFKDTMRLVVFLLATLGLIVTTIRTVWALLGL